MDFFKSVFADDPPDPPRSESASEAANESNPDPNPGLDPSPETPTAGGAGGWSFGGLINTLKTRSESVIDTYRRDLREFGTGLKKEIEVGQGSLQNVGQVIDEFGSTVLKGTAQIISQGKDAILSVDLESDSDNNSGSNPNYYSTQQSLNSKPYSRFDAQVRAIQSEDGTYCEEPEDLDDYNKWKSVFDFEEKCKEIEGLLEENGAVESIFKRVVPTSVDNETFWSRYFYRVHKLKQAEDTRANLVKRAISRDEEELSWDVDDDEEEGSVTVPNKEIMKKAEVGNEDLRRNAGNEMSNGEVGKKSLNVEELGNVGGQGNVGRQGNVVIKGQDNRELGGKGGENKSESPVEDDLQGQMGEKSCDLEKKSEVSVGESSGEKVSDEKVPSTEDAEVNKDLAFKSDENATSEGKADSGESCKGSEFSMVSTQTSMPEEEDLGWDEIEDLSSIDEKKVNHGEGESPNRTDVRKRLSAADEEEDLSWDIEDDDEPAKA